MKASKEHVNSLVIVTEDNQIFNDIPSTLNCSAIVKMLHSRTGNQYTLHHLGQRLCKNEVVRMEDSEDFVLALIIR
jgi:hypothetical protein